MNRRVLYFIFQPVSHLPPSVAQICALRDMGVEVYVLTSECNAPTQRLLEEKGAHITYFHIHQQKNKLIQKAVNFFNYGNAFLQFLRKYWNKRSVLWVGTEVTGIKMDVFLRSVHPRIQTAMEFYEADWYQKGMRRIAPRADILTACEPRRAQFMVDWWGLQKLPYVLRNKPYTALPPKGNGSTPELRDAINLIRDKKVLLYQGAIAADRDLGTLAQALAKGDGTFYLVLCGRLYDEDAIVKLQGIYEKTLYLGFFPPPSNLELTHYATAAVAYYVDDCLNNRYCAPNKIHEYAGCGVPMLCNRLPGLMDTVGAAGAAECVDFEDAAAVNAALKRIEENYDAYHQSALDFYDSVDNTETMNKIVEDAFSRTKAEQA